jgi:hypothetical protein
MGAANVTRRREILLDSLLLFAAASALVHPYYTNKFTDKWPSIESTFIADARFLSAHWPHPQWQPLWYTGTRFDYVYPPALRYGTAIISKVVGYWPVKAYHFYTMFFYCLGAVGVYLLLRAGGRTRIAAILAGAAALLMSPSLLFMTNMRNDSGPWVPVRLGVLIRYGEGPHITALSLLPFALAFAWLALGPASTRGSRALYLALAAIFSAAVVSNNFYGATSLAIFYPLLLWSFWVTRRPRSFAFTALAIPALAYGLTAFWLTPSYLSITTRNMRYVSAPGAMWSFWVALAVAAIFAFATYKLAHGRPERTWAVFISGVVVFFTLNVLGNYYINFRVMGEPGRLIPEFDLAVILGAALVLEWLWFRRRRPVRIAARIVVCLIVLVAFGSTRHFVKRAWHIAEPWPDYKSRVEYRITDWLWQHMPNARVCSAGTVRFWFNTWHDLPELGGGSEQGLLNPIVADAQWEIAIGTDLTPTVLWFQALGVDALYYAGPHSEEPYKDFKDPKKFAPLSVLYDDGLDNKIYAIPRRYPARARVVDAARLNARTPPSSADLASLRDYVSIVENGPDSPVIIERPNTDSVLLRAHFEKGQALLVQETWDSAWHAWSGGQPLNVHPDGVGFMTVDAPPGNREILLQFVTPLENRIGRALTIYSVFLIVFLFLRRERTA